MPELLLNLYRVPDDEADEVRALLREHEVAYYETAPHWLGISHGGVWTHDRGEAERARPLLEAYQQARRDRVRSEQAAAHAAGAAVGLGQQIRAHPLVYLLVLAGVLAILAILALPALLLSS